ncbi:hypothetical protein ABZ543_13080 [Streptomyces roseifaciens]
MTYRIGVLVVDRSTDRRGLVLEARDPLVKLREVATGHVWMAKAGELRLADRVEREAARREASE